MNKPNASLKLSKLDVARRQLDAALDMWFNEHDLVPIHTLACAAHEILAAICKRRKLPPLMFDPSHYREGMLGTARKALHKHYNFFKHANKDAEDIIEFPTEITEGFLAMSIEGWRDLGGDRRELDEAFLTYFMMRRPQIHRVDTPDKVEHLLAIMKLGQLMPQNDRRKFLKDFLMVYRMAIAQMKNNIKKAI